MVRPLAQELLRSLAKTFRPALFGPAHMPLNDPVAAMVAVDPQLASTRPARVEIELGASIPMAARSSTSRCDRVAQPTPTW